MPSSNKTPYLGLNKFVGTDKPKMADFNADNQILDDRFQAHEENKTLHLSPENLQALAKGDFVLGSYVGNGAYERTVSLGFKPAFGILFGVGMPLMAFDANLMTNTIFGGFFSKLGCSENIALTTDGLQVKQYLEASGDMKTYNCNQSGVTYVYMAWKEKEA